MDVIFSKRIARLWRILLGFVLFLAIIVTRLCYLQVAQGHILLDLGKKNFLRTDVVLPLRGDVYDKNGFLLASNKPVFDLYWQGGGSYKLREPHTKLLTRVGELLEVDIAGNRSLKRSITHAERYRKRCLVYKNLSFAQLSKISEQCADAPHLLLENRFERVYPHKTTASHLVGYLSRVQRVGCSGLERYFHDHLSGQEGYIKNIISATGRRLKQTEAKPARAGGDLTLTIDIDLQMIAEGVFPKREAGAVIVMDPEDGSVRALASLPNFDPNLFLYPISHEIWEDKFTTNHPLLNRATRALYPPASIFKLVTMAAGIDENICSPDDNIDCKGHVIFGKRKYLCIRRWGHGILTPDKALAVSCNIPCFEIGKKISIDTLAEYAYRFGLGQKTDFLLPERTGLVPTSRWKQAVKGERWWQGETLSAAIGQSFLLVTPLQLARMISSVCTGYLSKPRLLQSEDVERKELLVKPETLAFLREAMAYAVRKGTVRRLGYLKDFKIHAKTGTAQTCSLSKRKVGRQDYEHAWLAGFFQYKGGKPLALVILIEHVGAVLPAVQTADRFLRGYRMLMQQRGGTA